MRKSLRSNRHFRRSVLCGSAVDCCYRDAKMRFRELRHEHPYLKVLAAEDLSVKEKDHLYQSMDGDWPIYGITVIKSDAGFNISVSVKHEMDEWWECCDYFNPIPYELAPIIKGLI